MHFELRSNSSHPNVVAVEALMAELSVSIYDLETINHVRSIIDDGPYGLTEEEAFTVASQNIDHNDLADEYAFMSTKQRDAICNVLQPHRTPDNRHED